MIKVSKCIGVTQQKPDPSPPVWGLSLRCSPKIQIFPRKKGKAGKIRAVVFKKRKGEEGTLISILTNGMIASLSVCVCVCACFCVLFLAFSLFFLQYCYQHLFFLERT